MIPQLIEDLRDLLELPEGADLRRTEKGRTALRHLGKRERTRIARAARGRAELAALVKQAMPLEKQQRAASLKHYHTDIERAAGRTPTVMLVAKGKKKLTKAKPPKVDPYATTYMQRPKDIARAKRKVAKLREALTGSGLCLGNPAYRGRASFKTRVGKRRRLKLDMAKYGPRPGAIEGGVV